jgi:hypothetical protein
VVAVKELTPRRCQVTVELNGPATLVDGLAFDLPEFKRQLEQDHPQVGHFVNERPSGDWRHRSNWRDQRMIGRTSGGERRTGERRTVERRNPDRLTADHGTGRASTGERPAQPGFGP